jgi:Ca2+-binding RTX toxin-like protein
MLDWDLLGGLGDDRLALLVREGEISDRAVAHFMVDGGAGNDFVTGEIVPCILPGGLLAVDLLGGLGDDRLAARVHEVREPARTPAGALGVHLDGGAGNDDLTLALDLTLEEFSALDVLVDGGDGIDTASVTENALRFVTNCEKVAVL